MTADVDRPRLTTSPLREFAVEIVRKLRSAPFGKPRLHRARRSTLTSTTSTADGKNGATNIARSIPDAGNMLATTMATGSTKFTSTRGRAAGRCGDPGFDLTAAFRQRSCRSMSGSFSSSTTRENAEKRCSNRSSQSSSRDLVASPDEPLFFRGSLVVCI